MSRAEYSQDPSMAMVLYRHQSKISRIPPVGTIWVWNNAVDRVGAGVLQRLERAGLLERVGGDWWSATDELAGHMRVNHGVELSGSPGVGQTVFDVPDKPTAMQSDQSDSIQVQVTHGRQVTLRGKDADTRLRNESDIPVYNAKRSQNPAEVEGQMRLDEISEWLPAWQISG